jgi:hypothetical protein
MYFEVYKELGALKSGVKSHYVMVHQNAEDKVYHEKFVDIIWNGQFNPYTWIGLFNHAKKAFLKAIKQESFWSIANQTWDFIIGDEICTPAAWALGLIHKERYKPKPKPKLRLESPTKSTVTNTNNIILDLYAAMLKQKWALAYLLPTIDHESLLPRNSIAVKLLFQFPLHLVILFLKISYCMWTLFFGSSSTSAHPISSGRN